MARNRSVYVRLQSSNLKNKSKQQLKKGTRLMSVLRLLVVYIRIWISEICRNGMQQNRAMKVCLSSLFFSICLDAKILDGSVGRAERSDDVHQEHRG